MTTSTTLFTWLQSMTLIVALVALLYFPVVTMSLILVLGGLGLMVRRVAKLLP